MQLCIIGEKEKSPMKGFSIPLYVGVMRMRYQYQFVKRLLMSVKIFRHD